MATTSNTDAKIVEDLRAAIAPAYMAKALLHGALALLDDDGARPDKNGEILDACELLQAAMDKVAGIYLQIDDARICERIEALAGMVTK